MLMLPHLPHRGCPRLVLSALVLLLASCGGDKSPTGARPATATQLAFVTQPSTTTAGSSVGTLTVQARDASGNPVATFVGAVTIAIGTNPGAGTLSGATTVNAVAGVATFAGLSVNVVAAGYTLTATAPGLTGATSTAFAIAVPPAAALVFSGQPSNGVAGTPIATAVAVTARDAFGNTASTYTGAVTIAIGNNPGSATLSGTTTVNAIGGVATFAGLSVNVVAAGYTLTASAPGLTGATSAAFSTTGGLIAWTNAAGGAWSTPANWSLGRVPSAFDTVTIALPGTYQVALDVTFSGSRLTVGGGSGTQTLALTSRTLTLSQPLSIQPTGALALRSATVAAPVVNAGTLLASGSSSLSGGLTTAGGSILRVAALDTNLINVLTVANGLTNNGAIELTNSNTGGAWRSRLTVSGGTLVNAPSGTITALTGAFVGFCCGYDREIYARIDNQGTITLPDERTNLFIYPPTDAAWESTGTILLSGSNLVVSQTGTNARFTNRGTITISPTRAMVNINGNFTHAAGATLNGGGRLDLNYMNATLDGAFTLSSLYANYGTINLGAGTSTAGMSLSLGGMTVTGPGTLTVSAGQWLELVGSTVTMPVLNAGTLAVSHGGGGAGPTSIINGPLTNQGTLDVFSDTAGVFTINGDVTTSGIINVDVGGLTAGTRYGQVAVNGTLSLGGTLTVGLFGGYVPVSTNSFTILTSTGARTGTFATSTLTAPLALPVTYSANAVAVGVP